MLTSVAMHSLLVELVLFDTFEISNRIRGGSQTFNRINFGTTEFRTISVRLNIFSVLSVKRRVDLRVLLLRFANVTLVSISLLLELISSGTKRNRVLEFTYTFFFILPLF